MIAQRIRDLPLCSVTTPGVSSYQFEVLHDDRPGEPSRLAAVLALSEEDAVDEMHRHQYLRPGHWVWYRLVRVSHWDEAAGRWHGRSADRGDIYYRANLT